MSVQEKRTELFVGLFVFIGLAIMAVLILQFGRFSDRFRDKYKVYVTFPDGTGLLEGASVKLGGAKIGYISKTPEVNEEYTGVIVELDIYDDKKIPRDSSFSVRTSGLMGDSYVGIQAPSTVTTDFLPPGVTVPGTRGGDLQAITATAEELSHQANILIKDLRATVGDIQTAMVKLNSSFEKIDQKILSDANMDNWSEALGKMRATGENLESATAKLGPLFEDTQSTVTNISATFDRANTILDDFGPAMAEFEATAENAHLATKKINDGSGLMGALISDPVLKDDFSSLVANLREHGILRYKDTAAKDSASDGSQASGSEEGTTRAPATAPQKRRGLFRKH